jgi:MFS transporter, DHA2 family, multidrug resistance protein
MGAAVTASAEGQKVTDSTQSQLQLSFASAEDLAEQNPQYASEITAAAKTSFLQGDQWAYSAGIAAVLLGAALVFFLFPKKDEEERLLARYHAEDSRPVAAPP